MEVEELFKYAFAGNNCSKFTQNRTLQHRILKAHINNVRCCWLNRWDIHRIGSLLSYLKNGCLSDHTHTGRSPRVLTIIHLMYSPYKSTVRRGRIFLGFLINSGAPGAAASYSINNASAGVPKAV